MRWGGLRCAGPTVQGALSVWAYCELYVNILETFQRRVKILFLLWLVNMLHQLHYNSLHILWTTCNIIACIMYHIAFVKQIFIEYLVYSRHDSQDAGDTGMHNLVKSWLFMQFISKWKRYKWQANKWTYNVISGLYVPLSGKNTGATIVFILLLLQACAGLDECFVLQGFYL